MNPKLYARVKTLYDKRASLGLDAESQFLIERYYKFFVRAGAQLNDADQKTLRALNKEESTLTTKFREHVLADTAAAAIVVDTKEELAGLPDSDIAAAADAAKEKKLTGKYVLTLQNTTQQPALTYLQNRAASRAAVQRLDSARQSRRAERHEGHRHAPRAAPRTTKPSSSDTRPTPRSPSTIRWPRLPRTPSSC